MNQKRSRTIILSSILFAAAICQARTIYSAHDDNFIWNNLCVLNNQWGKEKALNTDWYQRLVLEDDNTISFEYKWDSNNYNVMGYPAFIVGWHWGTFLGNQIPSKTYGLPAKVGDKPSYLVSANLSHKNEGTYPEFLNVSWDIWLGKTDNPEKPAYEIMIWSWYMNQIPDGQLQGQIKAWGAEWDVYRYKAGSSPYGPAWNSFAFLRKTPTLQPSGDISEFIKYLRSRDWLADNDWIVGIQFGTELGRGQGSFNIKNYSITSPSVNKR